MRIPNNNLPPIVIVSTEQQRQLIPTNFVSLVSQKGNNIGSTSRFGKPWL